MRGRTSSLRGECDLVGIGSCIDDELLGGLGRERRLDHKHVWHRSKHDDGLEFGGLEAELFVEVVIDCDWAGWACQQDVAIGRRACNSFRSDGSPRARPVLDDHGLAPLVAKLFTHDARKDIGSAASGKRDYYAHKATGIALLSDRCGGSSLQ